MIKLFDLLKEATVSVAKRNRRQMFQILDMDEFVKILKDMNIDVDKVDIPVERLNPIQYNFDRDKVDKLSKKKKFDPILVSLDNMIIDGLHRAVAAFEKGDEKISAYQVKLNAGALIDLLRTIKAKYPKVVI
jgi:hypothetical protein